MLKSKIIVSCMSLLGGFLQHTPYEIPEMTIDGKTPLQVRVARNTDIEPTTRLIRQAYSYWVENDVVVAPATQSVEKTRDHLLGGHGFVAVDSAGQIRATFSLDDAELSERDGALVVQAKHVKTELIYEMTDDADVPGPGRYLEFKKLAVDPDLGEHGIGRALYDVAEGYARTHGYAGVVLETVKEATWLYEWYLRMGFKVYGKHVYNGSKLDTLLMIKTF